MGDRSKRMDGRCNAQTASGFCHARPPTGTSRCRLHGGTQQSWAQRLKHLDASAQAEVEAALKDPDLLDVRRPLALAETVIARSPIIPSDELIYRMARRRIAAAVGTELVAALSKMADDETVATVLHELLDPTDADLEEATMELHDRSMRMLAMYSKRQVEAVKALEWAKVIREQALPLLAELAMKISAILRRFVPDAQQQAALDEVRKAVTLTIGELSIAQGKK